MRYYIGIDNGTTGSIGILSEDKEINYFIKTPSYLEQSYTKKKQNISRVKYKELYDLFKQFKGTNTIAIIERPMVNPQRFKATLTAIRALEATMIVLEELDIPIKFIDSKKWQRELLPEGLKGSSQLKKASLDVATRLYPLHKELIKKQKDGDGILIAEYARLNNL